MVIATEARCKEQQVSVQVKFLSVTEAKVDFHPEIRVLCGSKDQCKSMATLHRSFASLRMHNAVNPEATRIRPQSSLLRQQNFLRRFEFFPLLRIHLWI